MNTHVDLHVDVLLVVLDNREVTLDKKQQSVTAKKGDLVKILFI